MYKNNNYLHFYGYAKKRDHYYNIHLCAYPITLYKKVTYIFVHMGTKKQKSSLLQFSFHVIHRVPKLS